MYTEDVKAPLLHSNKQKFDITQDQLNSLIEQPMLLSSFGGTFGLCQALQVDPTLGLSPDESFHPTYGILSTPHLAFEERRAMFGRNEIPEAPSTSFFSLVWAAYKDQTLSKWQVSNPIDINPFY